MRVIDADKLKEIVDRVYNQYVYDYGLSAAGSNMRWIYDAIESLQKELPTLQELDAAAIAYSKRVSDGRMYRDLIAGFIAGAEWMAEQIKEDKQ